MKKFILILCMLLITTQVVFAEGEFSRSVAISGQHEVENNSQLKSGRFTFVLTGLEGAPMPEGSVDGVKEVTIDPGETFEFGDIIFTEVGTFKYTVSRKIVQSKNLTQDDSIYNVTITVFNDQDPVVILEKVGTEGKPDEIKYIDKYVSEEVEKVTKTGDNTNPIIYISSGALAIILLILLTLTRKRKNKINSKLN